jgi:anti-anti-sigma regulatory factor
VLRITTVASPAGPRRLKVEGRLAGEFVEELSRVAAGALAESGSVIVDLAEVTFLDHHGVRVLRSLKAAGVELVDCSQFVRTMLLA